MRLFPLLLFCAASLTTALELIQPSLHSTVDLSSENVIIAWRTNATDPALMNLIFGGLEQQFATTLAVNLPTGPPYSFEWDARTTTAELAQGNVTLYLGTSFNIVAGQAVAPGNIIASSQNFTVKNYVGNTSTAAGPPEDNAAGVVRAAWWNGWTVAGVVVLFGAFTI